MDKDLGWLTIVSQVILTAYAVFEAYRLRNRKPFDWRKRWMLTSSVLAIVLIVAYFDPVVRGESLSLGLAVFFVAGWLVAVTLAYAAYNAVNSRFESHKETEHPASD